MQRPSPGIVITPGSSESEVATSEPDKDNESSSTSKRQKRRMDRGIGMNDLFDSFKEELTEIFETKFAKLHTELRDLKKQNTIISKSNAEISKSLEFMSAKYDEMKQKIDSVIKERDDNKILISSLEEKIELLEKNMRSSSLEIKNIPRKQSESKSDIIQAVSNIGSVLKIDIPPGEIQDVYRTATKKDGSSPIIVKFSTVLRKEHVLNCVKKFNKENQVKLNTQHIGLTVATSPIYVSEYLTVRTNRLFFQCREFSRSNGYKYC